MMSCVLLPDSISMHKYQCMFVNEMSPDIWFLTVSRDSVGILHGEHTMLLNDHVPGSACLHKSFSCMNLSTLISILIYYICCSPFGVRENK